MYCQYEQLKDRNVVVKCFNQALYHVSSAEISSHNYCEHHIHRLPRKTKLELLFDVIELPPSDQILSNALIPYNSNDVVNENDIRQSSAGLVTSNKISNALHHLASHERDMNNNLSCSLNEHDINGLSEAEMLYKTKISKVNFKRPFENLGKLCECYGYLPRPKTWRMLPFAVPGEISGLPNTRGFALATNGIHVAIENSECVELFIGHLDWFIVDDLRAPAGSVDAINNTARNTIQVVRNQLKSFDEIFV